MERASRQCLLLLAMGGAGPQLVDAGCNVIALSRKGAPANAPSWAKSVKWVEGNALVSVCQTTEPWSIHGLDKIQHVHTSGFRLCRAKCFVPESTISACNNTREHQRGRARARRRCGSKPRKAPAWLCFSSARPRGGVCGPYLSYCCGVHTCVCVAGGHPAGRGVLLFCIEF